MFSRRITINKPRDLAALLNRAAAAIETPADLTDEERGHVVEDLTVTARELGAWDPPAPTLHRCASPACPGYPWAASTSPHPCPASTEEDPSTTPPTDERKAHHAERLAAHVASRPGPLPRFRVYTVTGFSAQYIGTHAGDARNRSNPYAVIVSTTGGDWIGPRYGHKGSADMQAADLTHCRNTEPGPFVIVVDHERAGYGCGIVRTPVAGRWLFSDVAAADARAAVLNDLSAGADPVYLD